MSTSTTVDSETETGSIAESLARIIQRCGGSKMAIRALQLMNAGNCAELTVNIDQRLKAFLTRKRKKNDQLSVFERRKRLELGVFSDSRQFEKKFSNDNDDNQCFSDSEFVENQCFSDSELVDDGTEMKMSKNKLKNTDNKHAKTTVIYQDVDMFDSQSCFSDNSQLMDIWSEDDT